jgi:tetratricopeptide (TPR) repeat protein
MIARVRNVSLLLLILATVLPSSALLAQESTQPRSAAWFLSHQSDPELAERLESHVSALETVSDARELAEVVQQLLLPLEIVEEVAIELAAILKTAREFALAYSLYGDAYTASGETNLTALFARAQLSLQLGDPALADRLAREVLSRTDDYELKRRSYALVARALHADGRHAEAARMVSTLVSLDDPSLIEPETLLLKERIEHALGNSFSAREALAQSHPESIAAGFTIEPQLRSSALPIRFLEFNDEARSDRVVPEEPAPEPRSVSVTGIQVGSFRDSDNATHMVGDIADAGLQAEVRSQTREGHTIYTVVVPIDGSSTDAVRSMETLQAAGYDGFLIY